MENNNSVKQTQSESKSKKQEHISQVHHGLGYARHETVKYMIMNAAIARRHQHHPQCHHCQRALSPPPLTG